jgi:hypothetical protein
MDHADEWLDANASVIATNAAKRSDRSQVIGSGVTKKRPPARLDRAVKAAKKVPANKADSTATAAETTKREKICRYCGQTLYWAPDGHFECSGEGAGACSFWNVIGDYDRAGRPADIERWLDGWIQRAVGTDWTTMGWDRAKHAKAIRDYFKLSSPPQGTSHATKATSRQPIYTVIVWSSSGDPTIVGRDLTNREAALALGEKHQADVVENLGDIDERTIRIQK